MVRFSGIGALAVLGVTLAGCGGERTEEAEQAAATCMSEVRGHLKDAGAKKIRFGESKVDDERDGVWIVSGPVRVANGSGDYACRVVDSELDKRRGKRIADVKIAPHLLRK